jgi:hypothetical protein
MNSKEDYAAFSDRLYDYCHYEYKPACKIKNKLKSISLLKNSFEFVSKSKKLYLFVEWIRSKLGVDNTVWGIKNFNGKIKWEFYFYNWNKENKQITMSNFLKISERFFSNKITPNENIPYFMFSVDICEELFERKMIEGIHVYVGSSYYLDNKGMTLENNYTFYNPKEKMKELVKDIKKSAMVDFTVTKLLDILWPELIHCHTICYANKQTCDGIYFSRIDIDQFLYFLIKLEYPESLISFIKKNKQRLNHLYYDVGFDFKTENGKLEILKSGYYGTF